MLHCIQVFGPFHNARICTLVNLIQTPKARASARLWAYLFTSVRRASVFTTVVLTEVFTHPIFLENRNLLKCAIIDCNTVNEAKTVRIILTSIKVSIWYDPSYSLAQPELS